jgi:hypothetical protein
VNQCTLYTSNRLLYSPCLFVHTQVSWFGAAKQGPKLSHIVNESDLGCRHCRVHDAPVTRPPIFRDGIVALVPLVGSLVPHRLPSVRPSHDDPCNSTTEKQRGQEHPQRFDRKFDAAEAAGRARMAKHACSVQRTSERNCMRVRRVRLHLAKSQRA